MRDGKGLRLAVSLFVVGCCGIAGPRRAAADWPTYRGDAHRSGYTAEGLPAELSLRWTYHSRHAPCPAWSGRDTRMPFDRAYHPVIGGDKLFFGSSADCRVYALDAATGTELWTFFTGSPVRFAPHLWNDRVLVAGDDGVLYCLAAADGKLLWKLRGGPDDSMVLGNDRMTSRWPARGGPAIADGVVYFAAGIWPSEGIYIYAVDAQTGKVLWCNDSAGLLVMPQPHGGAVAKSGLSAQGNLVLCGDRLLVPTGRAVPAALNRADGKLLYFHLQRYKHNGGSALVGGDSQFFHGGYIFDATSGHPVHQGIDTPTVVLTPEHVFHAAGNEIVALDRANMWTQKKTTDRKGKETTRTVLSDPVWRMECPHGASRSLIVAGSTVVAGGAQGVSVLDMSSKKPLLTAKTDGVPYGLAAGGGRLLLSTDKGTIYCFDGGGAGEPKVIEPKPDADPYGQNEVYQRAAREILDQSGIGEGYCVDLACGDGSLAYALARASKLHVYAVDADPEKVALARKRLAEAGLYGVRVTVHQGDAAKTVYPNYFANLVVSGRSVTEDSPPDIGAEASRLSRPYGGVACMGKPGSMTKTVRGPLEGAGSWTHQYCDPANTNCSTDTLAKGPLGMLWFTDWNFQMPSRHGRGPAPLFLDGRLFTEGVDGLRCADAYNGRTLWVYPLPGVLKGYDGDPLMGTSGTGSNFCVSPDSVYVRVGSECLRIDPATGELLATFSAPPQPDGKPGTWGIIACVGDVLFGTLANTEHVVTYRFKAGDMSTQFTESMLLFAADAMTGKIKWSYQPKESIRHNTIAIGSGRVYLIDRAMATGDRQQEKSFGVPDPGSEHPTGALVALNATDGSTAWKSDDDVYGTLLALSQEHNTLLMCYQDWRFKLASELGGRMRAFDSSNGQRRWDIKAGFVARPIINGRTIYMQPGAWDLLTGEKKDFSFERSYGCGILAGSKNLLLYRSATLGYTDLLHEYGTENYGGIRPGCWINTLPAGGLVLMPDATDRCTCSYLIKASVALQPYGARPPAIVPDGGTFNQPVTVKLVPDAEGMAVRYTTDGTVPTASSPQYTDPIELTESAEVRARAFPGDSAPSHLSTASFVIDPAAVPLEGTGLKQ